MTWSPSTGRFTPGGSGGVVLPGVTAANAGSKAVTVQDLINLGLIDPGVVSGGGTLFSPATTRFAASVASALADSAASIELNSATLFKKMNGLAGMVIGSGGLAGYDSAGAATITLDPETGAVTLSGTITATAGTIGGFTLGATTLTATSGGNTTILSSGATSFSSGPTGSPTVTITQAGDIAVSGSAIFSGATSTSSGSPGNSANTAVYVSGAKHGIAAIASGTYAALYAETSGAGASGPSFYATNSTTGTATNWPVHAVSLTADRKSTR